MKQKATAELAALMIMKVGKDLGNFFCVKCIFAISELNYKFPSTYQVTDISDKRRDYNI